MGRQGTRAILPSTYLQKRRTFAAIFLQRRSQAQKPISHSSIWENLTVANNSTTQQFNNPMPHIRTLFWCCLFFSACTKREIEPPEASDAAAQYPYFPLRVGQYAVYIVDSLVYDFGVAGGTTQLESSTIARETVTDTLRDNLGALVYKIERHERKNDSDPWELVAIKTASRTATQATYTENNLRFLKLIFPMNRRSEWNGNLWIDPEREIEVAGERMRLFSNWRYEVDSINVRAAVGAFVFDSTLLVTEMADSNIIEKRLSRARYAKGVGLVWREQWLLDSQYCNQTPPPSDCASKPWTEKAEKGYILRQRIIEFGK